MDDKQIERLVAALDSLMDGELAVPMLIASGERAVPQLERFLLAGSPRAIALPRCRAARVLGDLGARSTLISYFREYKRPADAVVLFAEDAVRSVVARELLRWISDEVFRVLLAATRQRATSGLVLALGEFHRPEGVPVLFELLEDDLCREEAKEALGKVSEVAHQYAILSIRGLTGTEMQGASPLCRRRAALRLLGKFGVCPEEWRDLRDFLSDQDAGVVVAAAEIGSRLGPQCDQLEILQALFRISDHLNWVQEHQVTTLLDAHQETARGIARTIAGEGRSRGQRPNWLAPSWRILRHVLGRELEIGHYGAA
jgi:HEAT repeat protein